MSLRPDISPEDSALAAEYALGLLSGDEAAIFAARLAEDAGLRAEVTAWEMQFAEMAEMEVAPVAPPARLQAALADRLFGTAAVPFWQRLGVWKGLTAAALATSVVLALLVFAPPLDGPDAGPRYVAQIEAEGGALVLAALLDAQSGQLQVTRAAGAVAEGRAQELWLISGEAAPVSLGVLSDDPRSTLVIPDALLALFDGGVLAVSDEPPGGSPTGLPTGAVLAVGAVTTL